MAAAARHRDLEIRLPEDGIEGADREGQRGGRRIPAGGAVELLRPPCRIAQQVERLPRDSITRSWLSASSECAPIISTRLLLRSWRGLPASAATPPVPDGDSCPCEAPAAPKLRRSPSSQARVILTIGKGTRRRPS